MLLGVGVVLAILAFIPFAARVEALRDRHATGPAWAFPSRVYSDALRLTVGRAIPPVYLQRHLDLRGYVRVGGSPSRPGEYSWRSNGILIYLRGFPDAPEDGEIESPELVDLAIARARISAIRRPSTADTTRVPALEPILISMFADEHGVRRTWVSLERVPRIVQEAVIASEDRRFRHHMGLDLRSNARAILTNVKARGLREGGSTITQQLARGLFLGRERTFGRKIREAFYAVGLEILLSKEQILEMYLNSVYWGQGEGIGVAGIAEASRWYFDAPVESLKLGEAALLAGIIPAPNTYSPFRNSKVARDRRNAVLNDMVAAGVLPANAAAAAKRTPIRVRQAPPPPNRYPSFIGYAQQYLGQKLPKGASERWGLTILTTLDPVWQEDAEATLPSGVARFDPMPRFGGGTQAENPLEGAFVALDARDGAVRAMVGGRNIRPGDFNRAAQARRQPGSAFKPVVYAAALDPRRGDPRFTPASTVPDERREFTTPEGPWKPENDEADYHPQVSLAKALAKSLNLATSNLVEAISPAEVSRYAERFGLGRLKPVASIGLGSNEVTLLDLTNAYATFPNGGVRAEPHLVRAALDAEGKDILPARKRDTRVIPDQTAALMTGLLEDVVIFGVSYPLRKVYGFSRPVGGKTGTTNDYLDAWFVGFTPDVVAGVWVGHDQPEATGRPAAELAIPIWAGVMNRLLEGFPPTPFPARSDIELAWIDPWTGGLARRDCPSPLRTPFVRGTAPTAFCTRDHTHDWEVIFAARAADSLEALSRAAAAESLAADSAGGSATAP